MSGVWWLESIVPLASMKLSSVGICSRSEGTSGLSRVKCTLSKVMWITCSMPLPNWQTGNVVLVVVDVVVTVEVVVVVDVVVLVENVVVVSWVVDVVVVGSLVVVDEVVVV